MPRMLPSAIEGRVVELPLPHALSGVATEEPADCEDGIAVDVLTADAWAADSPKVNAQVPVEQVPDVHELTIGGVDVYPALKVR